jgi:hypothetical protein
MIFRVFIEALWYPGRNMNVMNVINTTHLRWDINSLSVRFNTLSTLLFVSRWFGSFSVCLFSVSVILWLFLFCCFVFRGNPDTSETLMTTGSDKLNIGYVCDYVVCFEMFLIYPRNAINYNRVRRFVVCLVFSLFFMFTYIDPRILFCDFIFSVYLATR